MPIAAIKVLSTMSTLDVAYFDTIVDLFWEKEVLPKALTAQD